MGCCKVVHGVWITPAIAVVVAYHDGLFVPAVIDLNAIRVWVQLHNLPMALKMEKVARSRSIAATP